MNSDAAIEVQNLEKTYRAHGKAPAKRALKGIDLTVPRGSIFALLGPNGAGKSTFINILAGLVTKTAGSAEIWGFDIDQNPRNARVSIGVVPQELHFDAFFTPYELLELQAGLYGLAPGDRRTEQILRTVRLEDQRDAYSRTLSGGMKRRLMVAKAMVHSPPVLVLDEPTAGVDIELRQELWDNVREIHRQGATIVLTTHYLEEAEELCDRIAIINHGEVVACEAKESLLARIDEKELVIDTDSGLTELPESLADLNAGIVEPGQICIKFSKADVTVGEILERVRAAGLSIVDLSTEETDLADIFLQLTRETNRE